MATGVAIRSYDWNSDYTEMTRDAGLIDVSNHSYGISCGWFWTENPSSPTGLLDIWYGDMSVSQTEDAAFGSYGDTARQLDQVLSGNPELLSVWAAGNDRTDHYSNLTGIGVYVAYFSANPGFSEWAGPGYYSVNARNPPPGGDGNGGSGYDSLPPAGSQDNLTVGARRRRDGRSPASSDVQMSAFSGWGPTDDGPDQARRRCQRRWGLFHERCLPTA